MQPIITKIFSTQMIHLKLFSHTDSKIEFKVKDFLGFCRIFRESLPMKLLQAV